MVVQPTQVQRQPRDIGCCLIFFVVVSASFGALSYAYQKAGGWCFMMFHSMFKKKIRANYDRKQSAVALAYDKSLHLPPGQSSWLPGTTRFFGTKMWRGRCCQDAALSLHLPRSAELQHRNKLSQNISENLRNWSWLILLVLPVAVKVGTGWAWWDNTEHGVGIVQKHA